MQSDSLNAVEHHKTYVDFEAIKQGGTLEFEMSTSPNKNWASSADAVPYSLSLNSN